MKNKEKQIANLTRFMIDEVFDHDRSEGLSIDEVGIALVRSIFYVGYDTAEFAAKEKRKRPRKK